MFRKTISKNSNMNPTIFTFAHDSDLHYGKNINCKPRKGKENHPLSIALSDAEFVIVTGDLTDNGSDGKSFMGWKYGGSENQLGYLSVSYVDFIETYEKDVYLCNGNHDRGKRILWWRYKPVVTYIKKRHSSTNYSFIRHNTKFICCGEYPKNIKWLKKQLQDNEPTFIFFHYNLVGSYSDWWTDKQKDAFFNAIQDYNIIAIFVGHHHISRSNMDWRGHKVISSANRYSLVTYNTDTQKIEEIRRCK